MKLGTIIRNRRDELGLTQEKVAELAGISKPYLSNIETGRVRNPPTDAVLESLESVLQFEPSDLLHLAHLERTPEDIRRDLQQSETQLARLRAILQELMEANGQALGDTSLNLDEVARRLELNSAEPESDTLGRVPIINRVAAGYPQDFTDLDYPPSVAEEYVRCPDVNDPQAFAARVTGDSMAPKYNTGDIVIFSPNRQARPGQDVFVRFETGATTFKRFYLDDEVTLRLQPINNTYPARTVPRREVTGLWPAVYRIEQITP